MKSKQFDAEILGMAMHVITTRSSGANNKDKRTYEQILVQPDPTPGTWGDLQLLNEQYKILDMEWEMAYGEGKLRQLSFNTNWLKDMLATHSELHCEYCGKPGLRIYAWNEKFKKENGATVDHFLPKDKYPHLALAKDNLLVACETCNNGKENHVWSKDTVKFPYPEHVSFYRTSGKE